MHLGTTKSRFGGHIGIPTNYLYDTIASIERADMRVRDKEIDWSSEDGKTLQQSLVLSEIEQVFGLARSILLIKTHKLFLNSLYPPVTLMTIYGIGQYLNQRMNLYARPLAVGGKIYLICVEIDLFNSLYLFISFDAGCTQYWAHLATDYIPL